MPFDPPPHAAFERSLGMRPVAIWLFALAAMVLVMVTLGGATRLTGSGLSIMEWAPIMGILPPLSDAEWTRLFTAYQQIPQYALVNQGFGLAGFKEIFWLEWTHRLWGRLMGVAFALPLVWFVVRRRIDRALAIRLGLLLVLGGMQGLVGWLMVASGFEANRTSVSPYRLGAHLTLAAGLYVAILWTALGLWRGARGKPGTAGRLTAIACAVIALTMLAGGFVAGLKAGLTYNSFPFMDGQIVPDGYGMLQPFYLNFFENVAAVQFDHRLLATLAAVLVMVAVIVGRRRATRPARTALYLLATAAVAQYALGVLTLLWAVPLPLGAAHQAMAMLLLTAGLVALHIQSPPRSLAPAWPP